MKNLLLLVDSPDYIRENCYQRQLLATLEKSYCVTMFSVKQIKYFPFVRLAKYDRVLSVLKLRTMDAILPQLKRLLGKAPLFVYEQDPWQGFMDDSPYRGAYGRIHAVLNIQSFLITSRWWASFVAEHGYPTTFVRMGMLPEYCDAGPSWGQRPLHLAFQGTLHPHRKAFFDQLEELGCPVSQLGSGSYDEYLYNLHRIQIYIHTEDAPWVVDGKALPRNAIWIKDTEVAARGTFAIRNWDEEADAYNIAELPTIFTFKQVEEVPSIIKYIQGMPESERNERMRISAETMLRRDDWTTVVSALDQV